MEVFEVEGKRGIKYVIGNVWTQIEKLKQYRAIGTSWNILLYLERPGKQFHWDGDVAISDGF